MQEDPQTKAIKRLSEHPVVRQVTALVREWTDRPCYLVGGALRDSLLGRPILDFDFVSQGDGQILAEALSRQLPARFVLLHEHWGIARLVWRQDVAREPVTLDFSNMQGVTIQEDLRRRDFSCNAMALQLPLGETEPSLRFFDPTGGIEDVKAQRIRMVSPVAFEADPVRMLRAFRLAASCGFKVDSTTLQAIRDVREDLWRSASERIGDELFKFLACETTHCFIRDMDRCGLLPVLFPGLENLKGLVQGPYHHLDAWEHTLETYRLLEQGMEEGFEPLVQWMETIEAWICQEEGKAPLLKLAALFHDIGKPHAQSLDREGNVRFYGHAHLGSNMARGFLERLRVRRVDQERVRILVKYHMGPLHLLNAAERGNLTERAKIRFLRRLGDNSVGVLLLALCDLRATRGDRMTERRRSSCEQLLNDLFLLYVQKDAASLRTKPLLNGNELKEALNLPQGPMIGRLLRLLEEARVQGLVQDRSSALELARSFLEKHG